MLSTNDAKAVVEYECRVDECCTNFPRASTRLNFGTQLHVESKTIRQELPIWDDARPGHGKSLCKAHFPLRSAYQASSSDVLLPNCSQPHTLSEG